MSSFSNKSSFETSQGSKYIIDFSIFESNPINDKIEVFDLVLLQKSNQGDENHEVLNFIVSEVMKFLNSRKCIVYFYCDNTPIKKSKRHTNYSNQAYRNRLFLSMFERLKIKSKLENESFDFLLRSIEIEDKQNGDHFISLITTKENYIQLENLSKEILSLNEK